jgi:hypothetical protein
MSCRFFGGYGAPRTWLEAMEDNTTNSFLLYASHSYSFPFRDDVFLFVDGIPIKCAIVRHIHSDSPTTDEKDQNFIYQTEVVAINVPMNIQNRIDEIKDILYLYLIKLWYRHLPYYNDLLNDKNNNFIIFRQIKLSWCTWAIEHSRLSTLFAFGSLEGCDSRAELLANHNSFVDGVRIKNQLYTFRLHSDDPFADFQVLYHKTSDNSAYYQVVNIAIPEDFIEQKDFLINLIPKALLFYSNNADIIIANHIDITNFNFSIASPKKKSASFGNIPLGPESYPINFFR